MRRWLPSAIALSFASFLACAAETRTVVLEISGMTCSLCPVTVRKALARQPGVLEAKVELATKRAEVRYDPARISPEKLAEAVTEAGFPSKPAKLSQAD